MNIRDSIPKVEDSIYFDEDFKKVLEDFIPTILNNYAKLVQVTPALSAAWRLDFYGLLRDMLPQYPDTMMWLTMRLNGLNSPTEWSGTRTSLAIIEDPMSINQFIAANYNSI